jgi:hypothetical protein
MSKTILRHTLLKKKKFTFLLTSFLNYIKKQRNKANNMNKIAKENFENNIDHILLD